jgi:hypothetical protein
VSSPIWGTTCTGMCVDPNPGHSTHICNINPEHVWLS